MKITNYCLIATIALSSAASAAFVNFGTGGARGHEFLVTSGARVSATAVLATNRLVVGYLTTPGLSSSFVEFANTTINNPLSSAPIGGFINVPTGNNATAVGVAAVKSNQVAIWVFGQGGSQGMYTSTAWTAPASITTEIDSSWDLTLGVAQGSVPPVVTAVPLPGFFAATYVAPVTVTVTTGSNTSAARYTLGAVIPEPTTTLLLAVMGGFGIMRRKRF